MKQILALLLAIISFSSKAQNYSIKITPIDSNILLYTSYGDVGTYKNIDANAVIVVSGEDAILFDTPWDDYQTEELITYIEDRLHKHIKLCIITHAHVDRIGGIETIHKHNIPTYCYQLTAIEAPKHKHPIPKYSFYNNDTSFVCGSIKVVAYYPGAGHTIDNIILYIPSKKFLYGGCFIKSGLSKSIGNTADADIKAWSNSVLNAKRHFKLHGDEMIIPGHGSWESKTAIENTLSLIKAYNLNH
ncbi:MAG: subclass B1 metallo-beta-lactamase [Flavipsychrobacter sp.]